MEKNNNYATVRDGYFVPDAKMLEILGALADAEFKLTISTNNLQVK